MTENELLQRNIEEFSRVQDWMAIQSHEKTVCGIEDYPDGSWRQS